MDVKNSSVVAIAVSDAVRCQSSINGWFLLL